MELLHAFSVPMFFGRLEPCERLNRELEALFLARETGEFRNPEPSHNPQAEMFESRFDLFNWPEACIQELRRFMLESVFAAAMAVSEQGSEAQARLRLNNHSWFHITRRTGHFVAHNHSLASWSAVYCVKDGLDADGKGKGGLLRLFDTRAGADAFTDLANRQVRRPFAVGDIDLRLQAGQLVVFPSYVYHEVTPYYGDDIRVTVATNCWFTD